MDDQVINILKMGGVGILPTDTQYGLVGQALSPKAAERGYKLKGRAPDKPFILLIAKLDDLALFNIFPDQPTLRLLDKIWPNPVSVILPCPAEKFSYLHRGTKTLAFRIPKSERLQNLLTQTGPLFAPSANPERLPPAHTIGEAKKYFQKQVDFYQDQGTIDSPPSTLIKIEDQKITVLRQGLYRINIPEFPGRCS